MVARSTCWKIKRHTASLLHFAFSVHQLSAILCCSLYGGVTFVFKARKP